MTVIKPVAEILALSLADGDDVSIDVLLVLPVCDGHDVDERAEEIEIRGDGEVDEHPE